MKDNFEKTALTTVGLDDSEGVSYYYSNNKLTVVIRNWCLQIIKVVFHEVILFVDWGDQMYISELYLNKSKTKLYTKAISKFYKKLECQVPENHPYKLFQFVDASNEPSMEIVCSRFEFTILNENQFNEIVQERYDQPS